MTKILVDECLPVKMVEWLRAGGFEARSVAHMGWSGRKDADILTLAEREGFTVLLTADANMKDQHRFEHRALAVLALPANRLQTVEGNAGLHLVSDSANGDGVVALAVDTRAHANAGATAVREPEDQFYGDRMSAIVDPWGHRWSIATHIEDVDAAEMARRAAAAMGGG